MSYRITTDSTADLPRSYLQEHDIPCIGLRFTLDGKEYREGLDDAIDAHGFYESLRNGGAAATMQINSFEFTEFAEPFLQAGEDVLHIAFSSGLSGTYASCIGAVDELREKYPDRTIEVVDSLCASLGEGLLVDYAIKNRGAGMTLEENARWLHDNRLNMAHWFTVNDLMYLHRGGRVSKTSAIVGTILQFKPVLHVDDEGHLVLMSKTRGRNASLKALVEKMREAVKGDPTKQTVFISHGDCLEDAEQTARYVEEALGVKPALINNIGAVIGSHSGPGTVALFFAGETR